MTESKKTYYQVQQEFYEIITDKCTHSSTLILPDKITDDLVLTDDFNMDSLDKVECIMDAEKHFDTCIENILAEKIETVGDVVKATVKQILKDYAIVSFGDIMAYLPSSEYSWGRDY